MLQAQRMNEREERPGPDNGPHGCGDMMCNDDIQNRLRRAVDEKKRVAETKREARKRRLKLFIAYLYLVVCVVLILFLIFLKKQF